MKTLATTDGGPEIAQMTGVKFPAKKDKSGQPLMLMRHQQSVPLVH